MRYGRILAEQQRDIGSERNFDTLDRIECQQAQLLVEYIEIDNLAEFGTGPEIVLNDPYAAGVGGG